jgi:N-acyl-D-aspartate/D-glutamate deacylase
VVRAILGNGGSIYGDSAFTDPAIGDTASRTYTYVVPAAYQWKYISVVGFITKYGSSVVYDAQVQNAIEAKIKLMWKTLSVNTVEDAITGVVLAPNPAMDYVCLSATIGQTSATSVVVTNSIGQEMFTQVYPAGRSTLSENIPLQNMPNGLYQVTIVNDGEKVTRKLTISR